MLLFYVKSYLSLSVMSILIYRECNLHHSQLQNIFKFLQVDNKYDTLFTVVVFGKVNYFYR